ncbi:MAG: phosphonate ABC transporter substrate-binding protein, partial [Pseudomonadota bacterium]
RSGDLPNDVLMAGSHVDQTIINQVRSAFGKASNQLVNAILTNEENLKYSGMKFLTEVKDEDYNLVRSMYATIGYPQYSDFIGD